MKSPNYFACCGKRITELLVQYGETWRRCIICAINRQLVRQGHKPLGQ